MSADNIQNDHSVDLNNRVIVNTKKIGYFKKLFGKAKSSSKYSIILEKNGSISSVEREKSLPYLNFGEKILSIFGGYKISEITVDHTPFNISYEFNKNDKYPLLSKDNQKISSFFSMDLRIEPSNPTIIFQSFPNKPNITVSDISLLLDQRIKSITSASISAQNSQTIRSSKFQNAFLENLAPQFKPHTELIGCEIFSWTPPIFGSSQEEEEKIELETYEHKKKIAQIERDIAIIQNQENQTQQDLTKPPTNPPKNTITWRQPSLIIFIIVLLLIAILLIGIIFNDIFGNPFGQEDNKSSNPDPKPEVTTSLTSTKSTATPLPPTKTPVPPTATPTPENIYTLGVNYAKGRNYNLAIENLSLSLSLGITKNAYLWRAYSFEGLKEYQKAINDLNEHLTYYPNDSIAYNNRGFSYFKLDQYQKALDDYNRALQIDPTNSFAKNNKREVQSYIPTATPIPPTATPIPPTATPVPPTPASMTAEAYYKRGKEHAQSGRYNLAIEDLAKATSVPASYFWIAHSYNELGQYQKAIDNYNKHLTYYPNSASSYNNRGVGYQNLGQYQKALDDYNRALQIDPTNTLYLENKRNIQEYIPTPTPTPTPVPPNFSLIPNTTILLFQDGNGPYSFQIQAPAGINPTYYWAIQNTSTCPLIDWSTYQNLNSNGPLIAGKNTQVVGVVSSNSPGTYECYAELRIGTSPSNLFANNSEVLQSFNLAFIVTIPTSSTPTPVPPTATPVPPTPTPTPEPISNSNFSDLNFGCYANQPNNCFAWWEQNGVPNYYSTELVAWQRPYGTQNYSGTCGNWTQENNWYQIYYPGSGVTQYDNLNKNIFSQQSIDYVQFCLRWSYQGSKGPWISSYVFTLQ